MADSLLGGDQWVGGPHLIHVFPSVILWTVIAHLYHSMSEFPT